MRPLDHASPFLIAAASLSLADLNAAAALVLTCLGIAYTGRKLWLSFKKPKNSGRGSSSS